MEYRELGHSGPRIPAITFGAWPVGGGMGSVDDLTAIATIRRALDLGITAIDTAEYYRTSEGVVGRALRGTPRDRVFIATKVSAEPFTRARIREALDNSLRALQTDEVDLYQLHRFPSNVPLEEALGGLAEAKASGKIRHVGVSNFTVDQLRAALAICPIQSLQPRLNVFDAQASRDLLPFCQENGIGVIVHSPLAKGLLTGKYRPDARFPANDERSNMPRFQGKAFERYLAAADELSSLARAKNLSLVQLAIAWTLAQPGVTSCIVGAKSPAQVEEHLGAIGAILTSEDVARIAAIGARAMISP
ncbi:MAG: aldo/keto reductase [Chloroflexota bacterium]